MNKKLILLITVLLVVAAGCIIYVPSDTGERPPSDEGYYGDRYDDRSGMDWDTSRVYDYLSPYGNWVRYQAYGYVWIPTVNRYDWRPYTDGRWVWSDYGWTWVSSYRWGWIPFHYGRWGFDARLGWYWVPGDVWAPAWVSWRSSQLYIGWAPIPPGVPFIPGRGVVFDGRSIPYRHWVFLQSPYFMRQSIYSYVLPYERNLTIINLTVHKTSLYMRNNRMYNDGLDIGFVESVSKTRIQKYELQQGRTAGPSRIEGDRVTVYNPRVTKDDSARPGRILTEREAEVQQEEQRSGKVKILGEAEIERRQREEVEKIETSQEREVVEMKKKMERETATTSSRVEKTRITQEYEDKIKTLKESHATEKKDVEVRHQEEKSKVVKKKVVKKDA